MKRMMLIFCLLAALAGACARHSKMTADNNELRPTNALPNSTAVAALLKTVIDPQSGKYAVVDAEMRSVMLKNRNGETIWSTNVINRLPPIISATGFVFAAKASAVQSSLSPSPEDSRLISSMELVGNILAVNAGDDFVYIDKEPGAILRAGRR